MVKICVVGCLHGELDKMYEDVRETELKYNFKTDIVLCCGDFQSVRNESDLTVMSSPAKYHRLGDFWKYYAGEKAVPYLTVFIGGNHEASNYLQELPYGGWVAPNVYYMGYAGVVSFGGVRIAGLSGIYKRHDFHTGHFEHAPYDDATKRTAYHVRNVDAFRLSQLRQPVDVVLSHDWPRGIYRYSGDAALDQLLREKPHFAAEIADNALGSPAAEEVLARVQPRYWFAAHHHCKLAAVVRFGSADGGGQEERCTRFLALDKCLPRRHYIQFVDIAGAADTSKDLADAAGDGSSTGGNGNNNSGPARLCLDPEWLCVLRATNHLMSISKTASIMPTADSDERCDFSATEADLRELGELFNHRFEIPDNFEVTAPVHNEEYEDVSRLPQPVCIYANPQTDLMCAMLELVNPNAEFLGTTCSLSELSEKLRMKKAENEDGSSNDGSSGSDNDDDSSSCGHNEAADKGQPTVADEGGTGVANPEEIVIGDDDDDDSDDGEGQHGVGADEQGQTAAANEATEQYDPADYPASDSDSGNEEEQEVVKGLQQDQTVPVPVKENEEQYDPADYPADDSDSGDDEHGYCPMAPAV